LKILFQQNTSAEILKTSAINQTIFLEDVIIGIFFAAFICFISYKAKFLTLSGTIATFILAGLIFSLGGIQWSVPILTFFFLSSILSKLRKKKNENVELYFDKSGVRDHMQVIANGGLGGVLVVLNVLYSNEIFYLMYLALLAAVCADTWATEIGTWKKTNTYNILNLQKVEQGVSGGISFRGIVGSLAGSFIIMLSGLIWITVPYVKYLLLIILSGLLGSLVDSILGATIQIQYKCCTCGKVTERKIHCGMETKYYKGLSIINNGIVNLIAGISGILFLIILRRTI
jgi:uncharacterized protein (TIGR00297 family)